MSNGNYVICDNENYAYTNARTVICRYKLKEAGNPKAGLVLDKQVDMAPYMDNRAQVANTRNVILHAFSFNWYFILL